MSDVLLELPEKLESLYPVPYMLGGLRDNTASVGWQKKYPWYMVQFILFLG